jgi:two-component system phosphate regulon sensor histidine kinase PhoR
VELRKNKQSIELTIKDEGIGIPKEHIEKIFDKLYRIPTGNLHNVKGFGLGLSYVKAIVTLNQWQLKVKSQVNIGSEFSIKIPLTI